MAVSPCFLASSKPLLDELGAVVGNEREVASLRSRARRGPGGRDGVSAIHLLQSIAMRERNLIHFGGFSGREQT